MASVSRRGGGCRAAGFVQLGFDADGRRPRVWLSPGDRGLTWARGVGDGAFEDGVW
jgi:hypothetical protein